MSDDFVFRHGMASKPRSMRASRYSPTPSIKRGKAEQLLKAHGSPPGVRVTAGGRIVPDSLSPIASPRFEQARLARHFNLQPHAIARFDHVSSDVAFLSHLEGHAVNINGQIYQVVGGVPLPVQGSAAEGYNLYHPPASEHRVIREPADLPSPALLSAAATIAKVAPDCILTDLDACKRAHQQAGMAQDKLNEQLKALNRDEVLKRESLTADDRASIVRQRIDLVNRLDEHRLAILELSKLVRHGQHAPAQKPTASSMPYLTGQFPSVVANGLHTPLTAGFAAPFQYPQVPYGYANAASPHPSAYGFQGAGVPFQGYPSFGPYVQQPNLPMASPFLEPDSAGLGITNHGVDASRSENVAPVSEAKTAPQTGSRINLDGSGREPRRSHAVPIKKPQDVDEARTKSLNPRSPNYEPASTAPKEDCATNGAPPFHTDGAPFVASDPVIAGVESVVKTPEMPPTQLQQGTEPSSFYESVPNSSHSSSAATIDFFPTNTSNHSNSRFVAKAHADALTGGAVAPNHQVSTPLSLLRRATGEVVCCAGGDVFATPSPTRCRRITFNWIPQMLAGHDQSGSGASTVHDVRSRENTAPGGVSQDSGAPMDRTPTRKMHPVGGQPVPSPEKTTEYRLGFRHGLTDQVDPGQEGREYLVGWRDGLMAARRGTSSVSSQAPRSPFSPPGSGKSNRMASFAMPGVPANSPSQGSLHSTGSGASRHPSFHEGIEQAFNSRANVNVSETDRTIGTQTSNPRPRRASEQQPQTSPLAQRRGGPSLGAIRVPTGPNLSFADRMQRLQVAQTGHAPYDGSGSAPTDLGSASPTRALSPVGGMARSPSKRIASSVLAAVGMNKSPPPPSMESLSPSKKSRGGWMSKLGQLSPKSAKAMHKHL